MNVIAIVLDSLRQDHVSFYHGGWPAFAEVPACQTPNLDAFAQQAVVFEHAYPEALPTIPVRTQLFTGQRTLHSRPWQPLAREDVTLAEILRAQGYTCGLITDCYHYRAPGMNFHRGFHTYRWIRGQEWDPYASHRPRRRSLEDHVTTHYDAEWRRNISQYLANTDHWQSEADYFAAQVVDEAIGWLRQNRGQHVFAWIDLFDPHEPWDPPARFDIYGDPAYAGKRLVMPLSSPVEQWATPEEIRHIRSLYAGEVAFVDHCVGRLLAALQELGYYDDSLILLLADHGHPLGDHDRFLKGGDRIYSELLRVPFMLRLPGGQDARRSSAMVQFHDLLPTLLDLLDLSNDALPSHGRSFLPVLRGISDSHRAAVITGYYEAFDRCIRDQAWSYIQRPGDQQDELYNVQQDPHERTNLIDQHPEEARRLARMFGSYLRFRLTRGLPQPALGIQGKYELSSSALV